MSQEMRRQYRGENVSRSSQVRSRRVEINQNSRPSDFTPSQRSGAGIVRQKSGGLATCEAIQLGRLSHYQEIIIENRLDSQHGGWIGVDKVLV